MDTVTAKRLCELTTDFYKDHADSFSSSRHAAWPGWDACLGFIREAASGCKGAFKVLDLACGNLRFEAFVRSRLPELTLSYFAVDNCDALVALAPSVSYQHLDILDLLFQDCDLSKHLEAAECDLAVLFGFMHHVPLQEYREAILANLIEKVRPGGKVLVTFWQFQNDEKLKTKALALQSAALRELGLDRLDASDFLLGWKNIPGAYRYCHSFSLEEIDELVDAVSDRAREVFRFTSDGRTGDLNTYVVFEVA